MIARLRALFYRPDPAIQRRLAEYCTPSCYGCYLAYKAGRDFADAHRLMGHTFGRRAA